MKTDLIVIASSLLASVGGLLFGYDIGIISGALLPLKNQFLLTVWEEACVVSIMLVGCCFGSILAGFFVGWIGRRATIIFTSFLFVISSLLLSTANSLCILLLGRFLVGACISMSALSDCMYIAEISPPHIRGFLVSLNELAITVGILLAYLSNYLLNSTPQGWRIMFALPAFPAFLQAVAMLWLPPSPRWLILQNRHKEAMAVLLKLRGCRALATQEYETIGGARTCFTASPLKNMLLTDPKNVSYQSIPKDSSSLSSSSRLKPNPPAKPTNIHSAQDSSAAEIRSMIVACGVVIFQQFTGQPTLLYYAPKVFQSCGFEQDSALLCTLFMGVVKFLSTLIAIFLIDISGRRFLLLTGISFMFLSLSTLSFTLAHPFLNPYIPLLSFVAVMLYISGYSVGFGPNCWLLLSEIFPARIRGFGMAATSLLNWGSNLFVTLTFLKITEWLSVSGAFAIYSLLSFLSLGFVFLVVPETKGFSLEEISFFLSHSFHSLYPSSASSSSSTSSSSAAAATKKNITLN